MIRKSTVLFTIFAIVSSIATFMIGATIAGVTTFDTYELSARFDDATGLRQGDEVRVAGVPIGLVQGIEVDQGQAVVTFTVDSTVPLPVDTEVAVRWLNLIGQRQIDLYPGTASTMLADGDPMEFTRSVVDIGTLADQLGPLAQGIDPIQLNGLLETVFIALDGNQLNIANLVSDSEDLLEVVGDRDETIGQLLEDYEIFASTIARRDTQVQQMVDNLVLLSESYADADDLLIAALEEFAALSSGVDTLLTATGDELGRTVDSLTHVTSVLVDRLDDVELTLDALPSALEGVLRVAGAGEYLQVRATCLNFGPSPCSVPSSVGPAGTSLRSAPSLRQLLLGGLR